MQIEFLTGACAIVSSGSTRILMDPSVTDGEYYGAWAHYPRFDGEIPPVDYIYVSHIHPDHFSIATLARLDKRTPVLLHKFPAPFLRKKIEALGFEVTELD